MARKSSTTAVKRPRTRKPRVTKAKNAAQLADNILGATPPAPVVKPVTHVGLLIDQSTSMRDHTQGVKAAFQQLLGPIKESAADQDVRLTLWTFGSRCYSPVVCEAKPDSIRADYINSYQATDGSTALHDSFIEVINTFSRLPDVNDVNSSFLILVITDGGNNVGNRREEAKRLLSDKQRTDRWTFVVSAPQGYVNVVNQELGIPIGNIKGWNENDARGMDDVTTAHTSSLRNFMSNRSRGVRASSNYFVEANIGRQGVRAVTKDLVLERTDRFRRLKVTVASDVKTLTEGKKLAFELGRIFYPLQKPETVQPYKEIILQRRDNPAKMYGGTQVRDKLGIPHGQEGKVVPGNLGEWIVWIQSTSPNRKLLAGMEVLYDTNPTVSSNGRATWVAPPVAT